MCWIDGAVAPLERRAVRADDSAFAEGRGCYTSIRIAGGRPRWLDRHLARLRAACRDLRLGALDEAQVRRALDELTREALPGGEGVVRLQLSRDGNGLRLVGLPRGLGDDRPVWRAILAPLPHDGASLHVGHKVTSRLTLSLAAEAAEAAGADEALLLDGAGRLVEGARSNLVAVRDDGALVTPPVALGAVAGIARAVALERIPELVERPVQRDELAGLRELVAINSVRGARAIGELDGAPVGEGASGPWALRIGEVLARD